MKDGRGGVRRLASGRSQARLPRSLSRQPDDGRAAEARAAETFDTDEEARGWLEAAVQQLEAQRAPAGTLAAWGEIYLARRAARGLASAAADDPWRWAIIAQADIGQMALSAIAPVHVAAFARALSQQKATRPGPGGQRVKTTRTVGRAHQLYVLALLRGAFKEAVLEGLIPSNPAAEVGVVAEDQGEDLDEWTWLTLEEIAQVLCCAQVPETHRLIFQVAIYTGLREGELWALRWERVTLDGPRPAVVVARSGKRATTKNKKVRTVPLLPAAREALRRAWLLQGRPAEGLVFPGATGGQRAHGDDARWADQKKGRQGLVKGYKAIAGIERRVRFHDLRHTCASHLVQGSWGRAWRLEEVKEFLGHSSIVITQRYAHLADAALHAAAAGTTAAQVGQTVGVGQGRAAESSPANTGARTGARMAGEDGGLSSVTAARLERATYCLGNSGEAQELPRVSPVGAPVVPRCDPDLEAGHDGAEGRAQAQAVLTLAALGQAVPDVLLGGLAATVLQDSRVQLALRAQQGDLQAALELAEMVGAPGGVQAAARRPA